MRMPAPSPAAAGAAAEGAVAARVRGPHPDVELAAVAADTAGEDKQEAVAAAAAAAMGAGFPLAVGDARLAAGQLAWEVAHLLAVGVDLACLAVAQMEEVVGQLAAGGGWEAGVGHLPGEEEGEVPRLSEATGGGPGEEGGPAGGGDSGGQGVPGVEDLGEEGDPGA